MKRAAPMLKAGTRGSALALAQTAAGLEMLSARSGLSFRAVVVSTPGDRDLSTPIERSAPDFFTRDLDDALRAGRIDLAVHSAKDLPDPVPADLDWFWFGGEDPRDCWVTLRGVAALGRTPRVGVSSARRAEYAQTVFPRARLASIRGAIDSRIEQLKAGNFDAVLMAAAGLARLYGSEVPGVVVEPIPLDALTPPEGQGRLAVTFRKGDVRLQAVRREFVRAVRFVSAGVGSADLLTVRAQRDLAEADVVLHDCLLGLPPLASGSTARFVPVGKRAGRHALPQSEINALICNLARRGLRVARLKGGDAGLFGRLAEETDALRELGIPFLVRPGVSALTAATTPTGLLLTRRGESKGFSVATPRDAADLSRRAADAEPNRGNLVLFMATQVFAAEAARLVRAGWPRKTPVALVRDAAGPRETVRRATLGTAAALASAPAPSIPEPPGLIVVGPAAGGGFPESVRTLLTCSAAVMPRARLYFEDRGRRVVEWPMIELKARRGYSAERVAEFDYVVFTSPSSVRVFFEGYRGDVRALPKLVTCGAGTDAELRRRGLVSDLMPESDFSAKGLVAAIAAAGRAAFAGKRVLRLRSALAGGAVAAALRRAGAETLDEILYDNLPIAHEGALPEFDEVFFASASGAKAFVAVYGRKALRGRRVLAMGGPTLRALAKLGVKGAATVEGLA